MTEPTFPPRLRASTDPAVRKVIDALANDPTDPSRAAQALARFEASAAAAPGDAPAPRTRWRPFAKVFLASFVALCALKTVTVLRRAPEISAPAVASSSPLAAAAPAAPAANAPEFEPETQSAVRVEDLPSVPEAAAPRAAKPASSAAPGSTFREELALVQSARASLKDGDPDACLRALDRYDRIYHGVFSDEIVVMRIEALLARGEGSRARTIAEDFLAKHPDSPYESRIRSLLSKAP